MLSPAAVYTTVMFLGMPATNFDLASLSFHVPRVGFAAAKHIVRPTISIRHVNTAVLIFNVASRVRNGWLKSEQRILGFAGPFAQLYLTPSLDLWPLCPAEFGK